MKKIFPFVILLLIIIPINVKAITLGDYKKKLADYKAAYEENQRQINKTQSEINSANSKISSMKKEMISLSSEISKLKDDVIKYNEEIENKELEIKKLIEYMQLSGGQNLYLEYAFEADNVTDLIYRMSVVEQITDYNKESIAELNDLIDAAKKRQAEINKREKELDEKQDELGDLVVSLGENKDSLSESGVSISKQIKIYENQVKTYQKLGCKDNDVIGKDCAVNGTAGTWRRPVTNGYVTSEFKYRKGKLHRAVDISNRSNPYGTKIYAVADGRITSIYKDTYGALVVLIEHYYKGKYYTSNYCHMSKYNPAIYEGMKVTSNTWIGYMGMTGQATGPHLHLEIFPCRLYNLSDKNCSTWSKYVAYAATLYSQGYKGPRGLISMPAAGVTWTSR
jgi:murein DD-endopeptidase MepM/ murein hydrolase activator NlpD